MKVVIAGGGTGGHLFPGLAVAREFRTRFELVDILFITGRRSMELEILKRSGFQQVSITVEGLKGSGWRRGAWTLLRLPFGFLQCLGIIRRFGPDLVLGVGGYSAGPLCLAARFQGVPTAIHEQNSFPGLTNRLLCRIVDAVFISFEESRGRFPGGRLILTGNPVRRELLETPPPTGDHRFTVLVTGGSQGARAVNRAFVTALQILKQRGWEPEVIHQTGRLDHEDVLQAYREKGLKGDVRAFIQDMAEAYGRADIVVGRAGATTVSELAALGKPSILIPYPHAADNHQEANARVLVNAGGAQMLLEENLTGETLADILLGMLKDPSVLKVMGEAARPMGRADAAGVIVDHLMAIMR